jgi:hypothetical protein
MSFEELSFDQGVNYGSAFSTNHGVGVPKNTHPHVAVGYQCTSRHMSPDTLRYSTGGRALGSLIRRPSPSPKLSSAGVP